MLDGDFARAWAISDEVLRRRRRHSCAALPHHLRWVWDGTPLAGRRVLVRCYHGLGDTIQFIRFVPRLAGLAHSVAVEAQPCLLPLLSGLPGIASLHALDAPPSGFDVAIESMELPHALRLSLADLPGPVPYLATSAEALPPAVLPGRRANRLRVGVVWAAGDWRRERSLPPHLLSPLAELPIDLVALQMGPARRDPAAAGLARRFAASLPQQAAIAETAALLRELDLVVTVDTMIAHLAGALGRPVWTLLDTDADWRWMRCRSDSPWYPTMRLIRQSRPGDWAPVVAAVAAALRSALCSVSEQQVRRFVEAETVSAAELVNGDTQDGSDAQDGQSPDHHRSRSNPEMGRSPGRQTGRG